MAQKKNTGVNEGTGEGLSLEGDAGIAEVQEKFDAINERGFVGETTDPTPNENYSLEGGADPKTGSTGPTPETDPELAREADAAARGLDDRFGHNPQDVEGAKAVIEERQERIDGKSGDGSSTESDSR